MDEGSQTPEALYLDLLKKCLTRTLFRETYGEVPFKRDAFRRSLQIMGFKWLANRQLKLVQVVPGSVRSEGREWPADAETMIGIQRLDNIQYCITEVLKNRVPGDLIETEVWRGGATIFMRAVLKAHGDTQRTVWVADSFAGLPPPDSEQFPADSGDRHYVRKELAIPLEQVQENFSRYGLLDDQVRFLAGWFRDTLPAAPIERLSILRLDGDLYESTIVALRALYPKLSPGGFVIVDDYGALPKCKAAVDDFRAEQSITDAIQPIDWGGVFWQRQV